MDRKPDRTVIYSPSKSHWEELRFPPNFPNRYSLSLLTHCSWGKGGPFQCLLKYGGVCYNVLLEFDENEGDNKINRGLQKIHQGLAQRDYRMMDEGVAECFDVILPFLKADHEGDLKTGTGNKDKEIKMLIKSSNGSPSVNHHDVELAYQYYDHRGGAVENPFKHLRVLADSELERLEEDGTFGKVRFEGKVYFLKKAYQTDPDSFLREFSILGEMPHHPNVISLHGVTQAGEGKIDGLLTPFIHGRSLSGIKSATAAQKDKWKKHISDAVHFLHSLNIVWGMQQRTIS
ncbi:hypothetical protein BWQ96_04048 [Gracilariopsis chorda]|uniref:Protein kinase domain-containing protein n=1 Tax=Gracilariopsis chorda TaxID=448386 RepID=A0A2V3IVM9_9FLOR|nr:hypothetical protein BWQ96_04048 [Gracilariopsis chorda]|eukprot:PXF46171.1 hypothetical protein BWQ96_04048 [Gracilariopsis chorda]